MKKPTLRQILDAAIRRGAPADVDDYQEFDLSDPAAPKNAVFADGPHVPFEHSINTREGTLLFGWDEKSRRFVWAWEPAASEASS